MSARRFLGRAGRAIGGREGVGVGQREPSRARRPDRSPSAASTAGCPAAHHPLEPLRRARRRRASAPSPSKIERVAEQREVAIAERRPTSWSASRPTPSVEHLADRSAPRRSRARRAAARRRRTAAARAIAAHQHQLRRAAGRRATSRSAPALRALRRRTRWRDRAAARSARGAAPCRCGPSDRSRIRFSSAFSRARSTGTSRADRRTARRWSTGRHGSTMPVDLRCRC